MGKGLVLEALCRNGCSLEHLEALVLYGSRIPIPPHNFWAMEQTTKSC